MKKKMYAICFATLICTFLTSAKANNNENQPENLEITGFPIITQQEFDTINPDKLPESFILSNGLLRSGEHAVYTKIGNAFNVNEYNVGIHPQLNIPRQAAHYFFTTTRNYSYSANIGYGVFSFGISSSSPSAGWSIDCIQSRYSKVRMYPSFTVQKYKVTRVDNYTGNVIGSFETYGQVLIKEKNVCEYS